MWQCWRNWSQRHHFRSLIPTPPQSRASLQSRKFQHHMSEQGNKTISSQLIIFLVTERSAAKETIAFFSSFWSNHVSFSTLIGWQLKQNEKEPQAGFNFNVYLFQCFLLSPLLSVWCSSSLRTAYYARCWRANMIDLDEPQRFHHNFWNMLRVAS